MSVRGSKDKKNSFFGIGGAITKEIGRLKEVRAGTVRLFVDLSWVAIGFLFGGCHLIFGAYPLGVALVATLPYDVWLALVGVSIGSLTMGRAGIIYAMICVLVVFLRVVISGGDKRAEASGALFRESLILRMSESVIGGFVLALYEILLEGVSLTTVSFGLSIILLPPFIVFILSGLFDAGIGARDLFFGGKNIFFLNSREGAKRFDSIFFRISALALIFLISLSLRPYVIFGISFAMIFSSAVTLFVAKRFGAVYATVCGFVASVGLSGLYTVGFALMGLVSGALFALGAPYALLGGVIALGAWGAYVGGVSGLLTATPEGIAAVLCMTPLFKYFEREVSPEIKETVERTATDMVGTMALSYRNNKRMATESLEEALLKICPAVSGYGGNADIISYVARLMSEARRVAEEEREMNEELTAKLEEVIRGAGLVGGVIRAFGTRRKYVICAGEDIDGDRITNPAIRRGIEECLEMKVSEPKYYRRDNMALMECECARRLKVSGATYSLAGDSGERSGDCVRTFETEDGYYYGLISDGMGSGEVARRASEFVCDFLCGVLGCGAEIGTLVRMLNGILREGGEECSATVDLFEIDLICGSASFIKSGSAPSFIKRGKSLFRIKSETVPLGLLKSVDAERICAMTSPGDYIIMMSDGVLSSGEDAPELVEFLNKTTPADLGEYARCIGELAVHEAGRRDDITVAVLKIEEI